MPNAAPDGGRPSRHHFAPTAIAASAAAILALLAFAAWRVAPPTRISATDAPVETAHEPMRAADLDDAGLRDALRRLASVDMSDGELVEERVAPFATNGANMDRVVVLLRGTTLGRGTDPLTPEEIGAVRAIVSASSGLGAVLDAIAGMRPTVRQVLANVLAASRDGAGRFDLDLPYERALAELAFVHPERSEFYLARLTGASEGHTLRWAIELYDLPETSPEVRRAVATAVAVASPAHSAAEFLADRASGDLYAEFAALGEREEAVRALRDRYVLYQVNGTGDVARRMLVSGMVHEESKRVLAVALGDSDAEVRAQAWTTLTLCDDFQPSREVLGLLREAFTNRGDADLGIPGDALLDALSNFATRSARGTRGEETAIHEEVLEFARELAREPTLSAHGRARARRILEQGALTTS